MDPASILLRILLVLGLVGLSATVIVAQSSLLTVRRGRLERLARAGERRARFVAAALERPADFIAGAQVAAAAASAALVLVAYQTLQGWFRPLASLVASDVALVGAPQRAAWTAQALAIVAALALVLWLYHLLSDRVPRLVSARRGERVVLASARPLMLVGVTLRPILEATGGAARATLRALGLGHGTGGGRPPGSPEDLRLCVDGEDPGGAGEREEDRLISGVLEFRERIVREVMTPRADAVALPVTASRAEVLEVVLRERHSRLPVYEDNLDEVVGVLLVKDLLVHLVEGDADDFDLRRLMREPYFVPDTKRVGDLLAEFRAKNAHLAIVLDEFGGTEGLVTLEDLIEEIVGDIYDEYESPEPEFSLTPEGDILMDGGASLSEANQRFGLALREDDFDTVGGWVFGELGRIPQPGDVIELDDGRTLRVEETLERRVTRVRLVVNRSENEVGATPGG